jgi:LysM repeat protein
MRLKIPLIYLLIAIILTGLINPVRNTRAAGLQSSATAYELIAAMNSLRVSNGYSALIEDSIINAVAQATAEYMAAYEMSWHIGDVKGRLAAAGYGGGGTVWATENFAVGTDMSIDEIMVVWADADHMRPATVAAYCHIGAGVAKAANGMTYYVLQAAYTSEQACGEYNYPGDGDDGDDGDSGDDGGGSDSGYSQLIIPVQTATPDADGKIYHVVASGQSLWAIAIAYHVTIHDLEVWNNISKETPLLVGQRLFIPSSNTEGYATPTPVGMVVPSTPDADGKIVHTVQAYNTLTTIAEAYDVTIPSILSLNGIQEDWPLQIEQKLLISPGRVTPSPTPRPLTPLEKLTPASDGKYYHVVQSGETLLWIAGLYEVNLSELLVWNGLASESIIRPEQKLVLQVTPPASATSTAGPPTLTPIVEASDTPRPKTPTQTASATLDASTATPTPEPETNSTKVVVPVVVAAVGLIGLGWLAWKKR